MTHSIAALPGEPDDDLAPTADGRYAEAVRRHGAEIARFVAGYERDTAARQDLLQEVHLALWRSLAGFRRECSLRTWVYRVAHNACVAHVQSRLRVVDRHALSLDEVEDSVDDAAAMSHVERRIDLRRVLALVHALRIADRQVMLLYLEGLDAASIADLTGLTPGHVATKIHRLKAALARQFATPGDPHD